MSALIAQSCLTTKPTKPASITAVPSTSRNHRCESPHLAATTTKTTIMAPIHENGIKLRDRAVHEEAQSFVKTKTFYPEPCRHFKPTLTELASTTFSDYIRNTVLKKSERNYENESEDEEEEKRLQERRDQTTNGGCNTNVTSGDNVNVNNNCPKQQKHCAGSPMVRYDYGIAKVSLPEGFSELEGIAKDQTGRGRQWQAGTEIGDRKVFNHKQVVRGIGGIYEYTFFDQNAVTVAEFREKADDFMKSQLGNQTDLPVETLERKFWKRLGPTMLPAMYGADMEGTLFSSNDDCHGFNISNLRSCLQLLLIDQDDDEDKKGGIPGVTTPYLYFGMWASVFCAHTEDMNLLSINYLHAGAPKIWYAVPAGEDARRFEQLMESSYHHAKRDCPEYLRHKRSLVSPAILKKAGIPFTTTVQYPGDAVVTFPGSYHFGFNTGFNVAEATNFAVPEWIPYGRQAKVCLCRPDSVRIDINRFERLLLQYEKEVLQTKRMMWADWVARSKKKRLQDEIANASYGSSHYKVAKLETTTVAKRTKDFWVEVMHPTTRSSSSSSVKKQYKKSKKNKIDSKKFQSQEEVWHLAKPVGRKILHPGTKVLCIIPAVVTNDGAKSKQQSKADHNGDQEEDEEDDEQCFAGSIVEVHDGHARIRLNGLGKKEDVWLEASSSKLFLDGGRWEDDSDFKMPAKHYWRVEDSRDRCI